MKNGGQAGERNLNLLLQYEKTAVKAQLQYKPSETLQETRFYKTAFPEGPFATHCSVYFYKISYRAINFSSEKSMRDACTIALTTVGDEGNITENVSCAHNGIKIQPEHLNMKHAFLTTRLCCLAPSARDMLTLALSALFHEMGRNGELQSKSEFKGEYPHGLGPCGPQADVRGMPVGCSIPGVPSCSGAEGL